MKTEESLRKSVEGRFRRIDVTLNSMADVMDDIRTDGFSGTLMAELRDKLNLLNQAVHEYSAYTTALETE